MPNELPASTNFSFCKELPADLNFDLSVDPCGNEPGIVVEGNFAANIPVTLQSIGSIGISGNFYAKSALALSSQGVIGVVGNFACIVSMPTLSSEGEWDPNVWRGLVKYTLSVAEESVRVQDTKHMAWEFSDSIKVTKNLVNKKAESLLVSKCATFKQFEKLHLERDYGWSDGKDTNSRFTEDFVLAYPLHQLSTYGWTEADPVKKRTCGSYVYARPTYREQCYPFQNTSFEISELHGSFEAAIKRSIRACMPFEEANLAPWVWPEPVPIVPPIDPPGNYEGDSNLDLTCLLPDPIWGHVWFYLSEDDVCKRARPPWWTPPGSVPYREVYIIVNTAIMFRVSDNVEIRPQQISITTDADSWCWSFSATIPKSDLEIVMPDSNGVIEVEIQVNNIRWRMIVESWSENVQFANSTVSIKGRSSSAVLASPYAVTRDYVTTNDRTIVQLVQEELTRPGITDWSIQWLPQSWLTPAGAFTYQGKTPLAAISQVVGSINGTLQTHTSNKELFVNARYKNMPWNWSTVDESEVDLLMPDSLIMSSSSQWSQHPLYNGIYVMGTKYGVTGLATLDGTNGAFLHPSVTDNLITDSDAVRERAKAELGKGGKKDVFNMELPMLPELGLLSPGMFIEVYKSTNSSDTWRGVVRDTSIGVSRSGNNVKSNLVVSQNVGVERYHG
jgi:hypothetical protein